MSEVVSLTRIPKYADLVNGFPFKSSEFSPEGEVPLVRIRDLFAEDFETFVPASSVPEHARLKDGDVVIGMDGDFNVRLWDRGDAALNQRLCYLRAKPNCDSRYIAYAIPSQLQAINDITPSTTVKHLSSNDVMGVSIPDYNLETQRRIADYLDRETGQIDAMIDRLEELETTLNERRVDAIKRTIASDTSIAIGIMVDVTLGKMLQPSQKKPTDVQRPYLRAAHVQPGGIIDFEVDEKQMWFSEAEVQALDLRAGDTVVVEGGAGFGRSAYLAQDLPGWGFQNSIIRLRGSATDGRYLMYSLHAALDSGAIHVACNAATFAHFTAEKVEGFRVPFHEPAERARIADHLDDVTSKIDTMLAKVAELKDLLTERRAALITDVVTGRKDVA